MKLRAYAPVFLMLVVVLAPLAAVAAGLVPPCGATGTGGTVGSGGTLSQSFCTLCNLTGLIQNIINFLIGLTIPVAVGMFAYAGFLYFTSSVNEVQIDKAKHIFKSVLIGFIIALSGWLVIQVLLNALVNPGFFSGSGMTITSLGGSCQRSADTTVGDLIGSLSGTGGGSTLSTNPNPANNAAYQNCLADAASTGADPTACSGYLPSATATESNIATAASSYRGTSTASGPDGGNLACAWAVNNVLANAGIDPIDGNSVAGMESALENGRGTPIDQSSAQPGDIVIQGDDKHVGICQDAGCNNVLSNSSSLASFTNYQPMSAFSRGVQSRIYQVKS